MFNYQEFLDLILIKSNEMIQKLENMFSVNLEELTYIIIDIHVSGWVSIYFIIPKSLQNGNGISDVQ